MRTFVLARLLAEEKRKSGPDAYALLHDYLVGAVELATGDVSTQTEEANQLLRYHLAQQRGVIPLRRLRFIRAHADRPLLVQPNARRLLRKSLLVPAVFSGAMVFVAVLMAGGLYLMATAGIQWQAKVIGRHWEENEAGIVDYRIFPEKGEIVSTGGKRVRFQYAKNTKIFLEKELSEYGELPISPKGSFIIEKNKYKRILINIYDKSETEIPTGEQYSFYKNEKYISFHEFYEKNGSITVKLWSVDQNKIIREIKDIKKRKNYYTQSYKFSSDFNRLVVFADNDVIMLYDATSGIKIKNITEKGDNGISFALHDMTRKICTVSFSHPDEKTIRILSIDDGAFVGENKSVSEISRTISIFYPPEKSIYPASFKEDSEKVSFNKNGNFVIYKSTVNDNKNVNVIKTSDMTEYINNKDIKITKNIQNNIFYWKDGNDAKIWNINDDIPVLLRGANLNNNDSISSTNDMQRAVIWGPQRPAELWDVKEKKLLRLLTSSKDKHIQSVAFSMNDTAVVIEEEGGVASLFDAKDGSPLVQHISVASVYYYDPDLRRIHLWNGSGQVIRHVEGRSYFGWFVPTKKGAMD